MAAARSLEARRTTFLVGLVGALSAGFYLAVFGSVSEGQQDGVVIFLGWAASTQLKAGALILSIASSMVAVGFLGEIALRWIRIRWLRAIVAATGGVIVVIGGTAALVFALLFTVLTGMTNYYTFTSPDDANTVLIAEEDTYGEISVQVWGPIYATSGKYHTNDYYPSLAHGTYITTWSTTNFTLTYQAGWDTPETQTVAIPLDPARARPNTFGVSQDVK